eukprot:7038224-Prymnesium_polylepis.1
MKLRPMCADVHDFGDWDDKVVIPEGCVIDVLRGRARCPTGSSMIRLLSMMKDGYETEVAGKKAKLSLLRCKNFFAKGGKMDPTRFRRMGANLILEYDGVTMVTELQVHHQQILEFNDGAHAHGPYEFFRSRLADAYQRDMDAMIERTIDILQEMAGVPVLLSMLVLVFKHREADSRLPLPTNRFELYQQAIRAAVL